MQASANCFKYKQNFVRIAGETLILRGYLECCEVSRLCQHTLQSDPPPPPHKRVGPSVGCICRAASPSWDVVSWGAWVVQLAVAAERETMGNQPRAEFRMHTPALAKSVLSSCSAFKALV